MYDIDRVARLLLDHEGERLKPYICTAGKLTIGVGRNLDDKGITREESRFMLDTDIIDADSDARAVCREFPWLGGPRQTVLIDMAFNLGRARLAGFKRMLAAITRQDWEDAAREMLDSKWAADVGQRAHRLAEMMRTGRYV